MSAIIGAAIGAGIAKLSLGCSWEACGFGFVFGSIVGLVVQALITVCQ